MNLIYFTNSFPYDDQYTEIPFLQNEIPILAKDFDIWIVPARNDGKRKEVDSEIKVLNTLAQDLRKARSKSLFLKFIKSFEYLPFIPELFKIKKLRHLTNLVTDTIDILTFYKWANANKELLLQEETIAYTYWSNAITSGLIYYREKNKLNFKIISRAHGADLYIERRGFIPFYTQRLKYLDKLFLVSKAGKDYLIKKYPEFIQKYELSYLGTSRMDKSINKKSENQILIISCSAINKIKRVDRIYGGLLVFAGRNPEVNFKWIHLGGGPLIKNIQQLIIENNLKNLTVDIKGILSNDEIHIFYKNNYVDCFIHASESEGLPVSFMEAQSYGIPIVSTNVGGVPEIVNETNGILIDAKADSEQIADAIEKIILNREVRQTMSENALKNWKIKFNAETNYRTFSDQLKNLLNHT
jgi:glycosyltransferase involved in cell wall biosynthesis